MDLDAKAYFQCKCMGVQVFNQNSCNFPGVGNYYTAEIDQTAPTEPAALPAQPPEPVIPAAPDPPTDKYNQVQMVQYLNALVSYQDDVKIIQDNYRNQMDLYQVHGGCVQEPDDQVSGRPGKIRGCPHFGRQYRRRASSRASADSYGWALVNKKDPAIYYPLAVPDLDRPA